LKTALRFARIGPLQNNQRLANAIDAVSRRIERLRRIAEVMRQPAAHKKIARCGHRAMI
jgi:hypothetical protein